MVRSERIPTAAFDYDLPPELIAQAPAPVRDQCRLLVVYRADGRLEDRRFADLDEYLVPGDVLVANETRVRPARLLGAKRSGAAAEVLLLRPITDGSRDSDNTSPNRFWEALVRPGRRLKPRPDAIVDFKDATGAVALSATIVDWPSSASAETTKGLRIVELTPATGLSLEAAIEAVGAVPLPPYIHDYHGDSEYYQTVFSRKTASAAAPTAGLHFTKEMIGRLRARGIEWHTIDLEVGIDTFRTVDEEYADDHQIHTERYSISEATASAVSAAKAEGRRIIAVGTTSVRALESAWDPKHQRLNPVQDASTSLFILPGYRFNVVHAMITNFHVPRSTLMMLVSAFATRELIGAAYEHAIEKRYRLLSFGDAMLLV